MSLYLGENLISGQTTLVGESRNIGQIIPSTIPLTDAGLHLLDGALINGSGIYSAFVTYIAELYNTDPTANYFAQARDTSWVQPILSSNGTMGGNSFAVSSNVAQYPGNDVWCAFDGITSGGNYFHSQSGTKTGYIDIYNPVPIKITNFKIYNQNGSPNRASSAGVIYGSDNGSNWTQLSTYTNSVQTAGGTWNIDLSSNENYYKYYRIESTAGGSDSYWTINEIQITAVYQQTAEEAWQQSVTTYGVCGKFVYDSVANTVRLPKITGIIEGTTDATALGNLVEAGLPNIAGRLACYDNFEIASATGPFYALPNTAGGPSAEGGGTAVDLGFDASRANSIYGASNTVQPQTIKVLYYIVIATSTKTEIEVDIDQVATDLNSKADVDLTNINNNGTAKILHCTLPSTTYDNLTLGASGTEYTAPADGWFFMVGGAASNGSCYATITNTTTDISQQNQLWGTYGNQRLLLYANKGEKMRLEYGNVNVLTWRFYYANGNAWEDS